MLRLLAADSNYEYMIKQHLLVGGLTDYYSLMYAEAIDVAKETIFWNVPVYGSRNYMVCQAANDFRFCADSVTDCWSGRSRA